jgi:hypothetical protein
VSEIVTEAHRDRHIQLHEYFDELLADFLRHNKEKRLTSTIQELMDWSYSQTIMPTVPR